LTPSEDPAPASDEGWCFPDSEEGILEAIAKGATHLWANTILFASHPLQASFRIGEHGQNLRVVGQGPLVVEKYDDKNFVNELLRRQGTFTMPRAWTLNLPQDTPQCDLYTYPVVGKPARGRGSHGVKVCRDASSLTAHIQALADEGLNVVIIEQYLAGEEATITVMPPSDGNGYRALPVVQRFNHDDGIAPYNGAVAVTANSQAVLGSEDPAYAKVSRECERVAEFLGTTAPIRIDVRRFSEGSDFALFDVNMKPVRLLPQAVLVYSAKLTEERT
jgi:biotin carboxylase